MGRETLAIQATFGRSSHSNLTSLVSLVYLVFLVCLVQANKRDRPNRPERPLFLSILLLDLPITGDLRGRGHRRGNHDLWPLDIRKAACTLTFGNPGIIRLVQALLAMLDGVL